MVPGFFFIGLQPLGADRIDQKRHLGRPEHGTAELQPLPALRIHSWRKGRSLDTLLQVLFLKGKTEPPKRRGGTTQLFWHFFFFKGEFLRYVLITVCAVAPDSACHFASVFSCAFVFGLHFVESQPQDSPGVVKKSSARLSLDGGSMDGDKRELQTSQLIALFGRRRSK